MCLVAGSNIPVAGYQVVKIHLWRCADGKGNHQAKSCNFLYDCFILQGFISVGKDSDSGDSLQDLPLPAKY